jgi:hypothetical protein
MPKPVCVPCARFFRPAQTGFIFTEAFPTKPLALPGRLEPSAWAPYKIWCGDKYRCEGCGAEIVCGFGFQPVAEKHQEDFDRARESLRAWQLQVNDC